MMKVYGDIFSGNCYKVMLLLHLLDREFEWIPISILDGETQTTEFLAKNPNGKIPTIELEDGSFLNESNAILNYLADGTDFLPDDALERARVLQWQFFEQYSHEPAIAVARFIKRYLGNPEEKQAILKEKQTAGYKALDVMETQLKKNRFIAGDRFTIADISLYAYTHVADEGGVLLNEYPAIWSWLESVEQIPRHLTMDAAAKLIASDQ